MSLLRWNDKYAVRQELIDEQHRYLFALINDFHDAYEEKQSRQHLLALLNKLIDYAQRHFRDEERVMAEHAYPQLAEHQERHAQLFEQIFALNEKLTDRAFNPTHAAVAFLNGWLADHILLHDLQFGRYLRRQQRESGKA